MHRRHNIHTGEKAMRTALLFFVVGLDSVAMAGSGRTTFATQTGPAPETSTTDLGSALQDCIELHELGDISEDRAAPIDLASFEPPEHVDQEAWSSVYSISDSDNELINGCLVDAGFTDADIVLLYDSDGLMLPVTADGWGTIVRWVGSALDCMQEVDSKYWDCLDDVRAMTASDEEYLEAGLCCALAASAENLLCGTVVGRGVRASMPDPFDACDRDSSGSDDLIITEPDFDY